MRRFLIYASIIVSVIAVGVIIGMWEKYSYGAPSPVTPQATITPSPISPTPSSPTPAPSPVPIPAPGQVSTLFYPMTNYDSRITVRRYGQPTVASDRNGLPCGSPFVGLHTGDDLEVTSEEATPPIPIYAIADGSVRFVGHSTGYGGLLVLEHKVNNQTVTAYYGHINLGSTKLTTSNKVTAGQKIAELGQGCSQETDNERKHLHFAIRLGNSVDKRGYVPTQTELAKWINPQDFFAKNQASNPQ